jgi:hypothetical protein
MNEQEQQRFPLVEAYPVEDKYVDGLGRIEVTGHNVRFVFYTGRPKDGGEYDREIATRVVMPMEGVMPLLKQVIAMAPILKLLDVEQLCKAVAAITSGMMMH